LVGNERGRGRGRNSGKMKTKEKDVKRREYVDPDEHRKAGIVSQRNALGRMGRGTKERGGGRICQTKIS